MNLAASALYPKIDTPSVLAPPASSSWSNPAPEPFGEALTRLADQLAPRRPNSADSGDAAGAAANRASKSPQDIDANAQPDQRHASSQQADDTTADSDDASRWDASKSAGADHPTHRAHDDNADNQSATLDGKSSASPADDPAQPADKGNDVKVTDAAGQVAQQAAAQDLTNAAPPGQPQTVKATKTVEQPSPVQSPDRISATTVKQAASESAAGQSTTSPSTDTDHPQASAEESASPLDGNKDKSKTLVKEASRTAEQAASADGASSSGDAKTPAVVGTAATSAHNAAAGAQVPLDSANAGGASGVNQAGAIANTSVSHQSSDALANAALASPTPSTDSDPNVARVARGLQSALAQHGGSVTLRLQPPELGMVRIQLDVQDGTVRAQFTADQESVRMLLTHEIGQLHQALEKQGLTVDRLDVLTAGTAPSHSGTSSGGTGEDARGTGSDSQTAGRFGGNTGNGGSWGGAGGSGTGADFDHPADAQPWEFAANTQTSDQSSRLIRNVNMVA